MKPAIFGLGGYYLTSEERNFFQANRPAGFIIFKRNIASKEQLSELCSSLKELFPQRQVLILIDQEGGRVQRLTEPLTKKYPASQFFVDLIPEKGLEKALEATYNSNFAMAQELVSLGVNVNCTPVADLRLPITNNVIGDRSFGDKPEIVDLFCKEVIRAHLDAGIEPIIKHIPGHGRAIVDSHFKLPVVDTPLSELEATDFSPFRSLAELCNYAMTAHIIYTALDAEHTATLSKTAINYIRNNIGFNGKIITDCITMKALPGTYAEKASGAIAAGCNFVLHCNGNLEEMREIAGALVE